jgi:hypothetical protein
VAATLLLVPLQAWLTSGHAPHLPKNRDPHRGDL